MKKEKIFLALLTIAMSFFVSSAANASTCEVVSGDGSNLGDEIVCGDEHFYVLKKADDKVSMLSKYNLYVGDKIEKDGSFKLSDYHSDPEYEAYTAAEAYCDGLKATYGEDNVLTTGKYNGEMSPMEFFCRIYKPLEYTEVKQDARAIGLYPNGNSEVVYPIYGSLDFDRENTPDEFDENYDIMPEKSKLKEYFEGYSETLAGIGVNVLDMGFIKRSGVQEILDQIGTGEITIPTYIPGGEKANPSEPDWEDGFYPDYGTQFFFKVNIKEHLPSEYQWLIGTSFWTGSATYYLDEEFSEEYYYDEFLTTVGDYCSYDRGCIIPMIGIGLRPVVTIPASDISINTEKNPNTADDIASYLAIGVLSLAGIISCGLYINRHLTHSL